MTSQPIFSYPSIITYALKRSDVRVESGKIADLNNKSPESKIMGEIPSLFNWLIVVNFLDRPPSGFFGQPQGSNWP
ncbi:MAG: hypothetical protein ACKVHA_07770 [Fidelibacterota bacterium]